MNLQETFKDLQDQMQQQMTSRQKLETQFQENRIVLDEFEASQDDNVKVFKLIGPVLLPQDKEEAIMNVQKRIEFIQNEISGVETQMEKTRADLTKTRNSLIESQVPQQQQQQQQTAV